MMVLFFVMFSGICFLLFLFYWLGLMVMMVFFCGFFLVVLGMIRLDVVVVLVLLVCMRILFLSGLMFIFVMIGVFYYLD